MERTYIMLCDNDSSKKKFCNEMSNCSRVQRVIASPLLNSFICRRLSALQQMRKRNYRKKHESYKVDNRTAPIQARAQNSSGRPFQANLSALHKSKKVQIQIAWQSPFRLDVFCLTSEERWLLHNYSKACPTSAAFNTRVCITCDSESPVGLGIYFFHVKI